MTQLPKHPVVKYLLASYLYYIHDSSIMEDPEFDALAKYLLDNPDVHASHPHGELISKDDLEAGTLLLKHEEYPMILRYAAKRICPEIVISNEIEYCYEKNDMATLQNNRYSENIQEHEDKSRSGYSELSNFFVN